MDQSNPISPFAQHILRFSGVQDHAQVLQALAASRLQEESANLFGQGAVDMFVTKDSNNQHATVDIAAKNLNALHFAGGFFRGLCRDTIGVAPKPILINGPAGDIFERNIERSN
jgi:hypothetical protein